MPIGSDTLAWRRDLPHLQKSGRTYEITFRARIHLTPDERTIALDCCRYGHDSAYWLDCVVIMPDHVHMVICPYVETNLSRLMKSIKGVSANLINKRRGRRGPLWQREYFDRILRNAERRRRKAEYIAMNPVRAGLVSTPDEYRWLWRSWVDGDRS